MDYLVKERFSDGPVTRRVSGGFIEVWWHDSSKDAARGGYLTLQQADDFIKQLTEAVNQSNEYKDIKAEIVKLNDSVLQQELKLREDKTKLDALKGRLHDFR